MATTGSIEGIGFGSTKNLSFPTQPAGEPGLSPPLSLPDQPVSKHEGGVSQEPDSLHFTQSPRQPISEDLAVAHHTPGKESSELTIESTQNGHKQLSEQETKALAQKFEEALNSTEIRFRVDLQKDDNHQLTFQVIDKKTGQVLRQYPPHEILELTEQTKTIKGVFLTDTA